MYHTTSSLRLYMAHVQQLFDHINKNFRDTYKSGVWVKSYVTGIAINNKGDLFFECIDAMKVDLQKSAARVIFRMKPPFDDCFYRLCQKLDIDPSLPETIRYKPGQCYMSFKVVPQVHFERGLMPLIQDIDADDDTVGIENMRSGLRIGIKNKYLSKPENNMKPWSDEDINHLYYLLHSTNTGIESIGVILKRTPIACVDKITSMSMVSKERISLMRKEALKLQELHNS